MSEKDSKISQKIETFQDTSSNLLNYLLHNNIILDLKGKTKEKIIRELLNLLPVKNKELILEKILSRDRIMSMCPGKSVGIFRYIGEPVKELQVALGIHKRGIDFSSLDGKPVKIIFLLLAPEHKEKEYIDLIAQIFKVMSEDSVRNQLLTAKTKKEVLDAISS